MPRRERKEQNSDTSDPVEGTASHTASSEELAKMKPAEEPGLDDSDREINPQNRLPIRPVKRGGH